MEVESKGTIHVITNAIGFTPYMTHWGEAFDDYGYDVKLYPGHNYSLKRLQPGEFAFKAMQSFQIFEDFCIKDGDVVIFADAWHLGAIFLNDYRIWKNLKIRVFGFWQYTPFNLENKIWKSLAGKQELRRWYKRQEYSLYDSYTYNCFFSEKEKLIFQRKCRYNQVALINRSHTTGYPFGHLFENDHTLEDKENIVLVPMNPLNYAQNVLLKAIELDLVDYKFVYLQKVKPSRFAYKQLLKKAKILFLNKKWEYDPSLIVEAMKYGLIPLIPSSKKVEYKLLFPEKYRYDAIVVDKHTAKRNHGLFMLRNRGRLVDSFKNIIDNYQELRLEAISDSDKIIETHFTNTKFLE